MTALQIQTLDLLGAIYRATSDEALKARCQAKMVAIRPADTKNVFGDAFKDLFDL